VGDKPWYHHEVNLAFTENLIGDIYIAVFGITSSYWFHFSPFLSNEIISIYNKVKGNRFFQKEENTGVE
jgi:hypothetical protein